MIDPKKKEQIEKFMLHVVDTWAGHRENHIENMSDFFHDSFTGYGTEAVEIWKTKEDMVRQQEIEHEQASGGFRYKLRDLTVATADNVTFVCSFLMDMELPAGDRVLIFNDFRSSVVVYLEGKNPLITHWHASKGGKSDMGVFPGVLGPVKYEEVSVLFTDFAGFTNTVSTLPATTLVNELNDIFSAFDTISLKHGVHKVKTIGDAYMAVAGLGQQDRSHALAAVKAAKEMIEHVEQRNSSSAWKWRVRAGVHSGPIVGGFVGIDQTDFDIWGDTVNIASHLESCSEPGRINISAYTYHLIHSTIPCEYRGKIQAKGKGEIDMYFVNQGT